MPAPVPEPGQLVTVRQRRWVVLEVKRGELPPDARRDIADSAPQHLVVAQALDEDGGEADELAVVWEIEPGTQVHERATLPDPARGFDPPDHVEAFLDAVRWGAVASADIGVLHAPFRSGITLEDYQLDPDFRSSSRNADLDRAAAMGILPTGQVVELGTLTLCPTMTAVPGDRTGSLRAPRQ